MTLREYQQSVKKTMDYIKSLTPPERTMLYEAECVLLQYVGIAIGSALLKFNIPLPKRFAKDNTRFPTKELAHWFVNLEAGIL